MNPSPPLSAENSPSGSRSEEHTSEPSHGYISYAVFCLKKKKKNIRGCGLHKDCRCSGWEIVNWSYGGARCGGIICDAREARRCVIGARRCVVGLRSGRG